MPAPRLFSAWTDAEDDEFDPVAHAQVLTTTAATHSSTTLDGLAATTGLEVGKSYRVDGAGIVSGTAFTYGGSGAGTLDRPAIATASPVAVTFSREDLKVYSLEIGQGEGAFPAAILEVRNPRVGLLGPGRQTWIWIAWDSGSGIEPLFRGQLLGVPDQLQNEAVSLTFVARPVDYHDQKEALAATLREAPFWDQIWLADRVADPDTVLEARAAAWHIDRLSLEVSASDMIAGEDGLRTFLSSQHYYSGLSATYGDQPLKRMRVKGTVTWPQTATGTIDATPELGNAFAAALARPSPPLVSTYTGKGLMAEWPEPGANIGDGWSFASGTSIELATWMRPIPYDVDYPNGEDLAPIQVRPFEKPFTMGTTADLVEGSTAIANLAFAPPGGGFSVTDLQIGRAYYISGDGIPSDCRMVFDGAGAGTLSAEATADGTAVRVSIWLPWVQYLSPGQQMIPLQLGSAGIDPFVNAQGPAPVSMFNTWRASFTQNAFKIGLFLGYDVTRERSEAVEFVLEADIQALLTDPGAAEEESIDLTSDLVGQFSDPDGSMPIGDLRRSSYFKTARGQQSFQYLLALPRAKLLARSRAVLITLQTRWSLAFDLSCRMNAQVFDDRLPGGQATGKIISYKLTANEQTPELAEIVIGCTIGKGGSVTASTGSPSWVEEGWVERGWQEYAGEEIDVFAAKLIYQSFDDFTIDDDGLNLLALTASAAIANVSVENGLEAQRDAIAAGVAASDPVAFLIEAPTKVTLELKPLTGAFTVSFNPEVSVLKVPQTIDLEAA